MLPTPPIITLRPWNVIITAVFRICVSVRARTPARAHRIPRRRIGQVLWPYARQGREVTFKLACVHV